MSIPLQTRCAGCGKRFPDFRWNIEGKRDEKGVYRRVRTSKEPVTRHPYEPFCTLRCALHYAQAMWKQLNGRK